MFKIGDVVRHKGFGVAMTVEGDAYENGGLILVPCVWFELDDGEFSDLRRASFEEKSLIPGRLRPDEMAPRLGDTMPPAPAPLHAFSKGREQGRREGYEEGLAAGRGLPSSGRVNEAIRRGAENAAAAFRATEAEATRPHPLHVGLDRELYLAYSEQAGGKTYLGSPMPAWEHVPAHIQDNWTAVAKAAIRIVGGR